MGFRDGSPLALDSGRSRLASSGGGKSRSRREFMAAIEVGGEGRQGRGGSCERRRGNSRFKDLGSFHDDILMREIL